MNLLIDNYDSFSYNLYQLIGSIDPNLMIVRNDVISVAEVRQLAPDHIIISPGPGRPAAAGICIELIRQLHTDIPILGICLGHQAIYEAFGGTVSYAAQLMHGKASRVTVDVTDQLFRGLPPEILAARYHSLIAIPETLPDMLRVTAWTDDRQIMAVRHETAPVYGVQFHPESILTPSGKQLLHNFIVG